MDYPKHVPYSKAVEAAGELEGDARTKALADAFVTCRSAAEEEAVLDGTAVITVIRSAERVNYKFAGFPVKKSSGKKS